MLPISNTLPLCGLRPGKKRFHHLLPVNEYAEIRKGTRKSDTLWFGTYLWSCACRESDMLELSEIRIRMPAQFGNMVMVFN